MQRDIDNMPPITAGELLLRIERCGDHAGDVAERLAALAVALVVDHDFQTRAALAWHLRAHADYLTGDTANEAAAH
jgi:hypothetical protein